MNKTTMVVMIAIFATVISTILSLMIRGRDISPTLKKTLWATFITGILVFIIIILKISIR